MNFSIFLQEMSVFKQQSPGKVSFSGKDDVCALKCVANLETNEITFYQFIKVLQFSIQYTGNTYHKNILVRLKNVVC